MYANVMLIEIAKSIGVWNFEVEGKILKQAFADTSVREIEN